MQRKAASAKTPGRTGKRNDSSIDLPLDVPDGYSPIVDEATGQALDEATLGDLESLLGISSPNPAVRERLRHTVRNYLLATTPADGSGEVVMIRWAQVRQRLEDTEKVAVATYRAARALVDLFDPWAGADKRDCAERDRARGMIQAVGGNQLTADMRRLVETMRVVALLEQFAKTAREAPRRIPSGPRRGLGRRDALMVPLLGELAALIEEHAPGTPLMHHDRTDDAYDGPLYEMTYQLAMKLPRTPIGRKSPMALGRAITRHLPAARRTADLLRSLAALGVVHLLRSPLSRQSDLRAKREEVLTALEEVLRPEGLLEPPPSSDHAAGTSFARSDENSSRETRVSACDLARMRIVRRNRAVQVRVSGRERAVWRAAAVARGLDLSELVRDAVRTCLAQNELRRAQATVNTVTDPNHADHVS